ncbi:MAG TPA: MBL fold metallo-hydrolase [Solirubrobacterales bacterium]|nr:MBL fold metallo-hydrolase [Solirubrobacterales bacterium]
MKQLAPDVWQLRGFRNAINVYMIEDVLIDAATKLAGRRVLGEIESRPLSMVALTHCHPDHQGVAKKVCEARGVPLACHADDVDAMEGRAPVQPANPDHPLNRLISAAWAGPPHEVGRVLQEGDEVAGFRVVHAPGHAPGEVIYFRDSDRVAICGDVVNNVDLATGRVRVGEPPDLFTLDVAENRRSIRKLAELEPTLVLAGHGPPLRDVAELERLAGSLG